MPKVVIGVPKLSPLFSDLYTSLREMRPACVDFTVVSVPVLPCTSADIAVQELLNTMLTVRSAAFFASVCMVRTVYKTGCGPVPSNRTAGVVIDRSGVILAEIDVPRTDYIPYPRRTRLNGCKPFDVLDELTAMIVQATNL